jgi:hypothetical protein
LLVACLGTGRLETVQKNWAKKQFQKDWSKNGSRDSRGPFFFGESLIEGILVGHQRIAQALTVPEAGSGR